MKIWNCDKSDLSSARRVRVRVGEKLNKYLFENNEYENTIWQD